MPIWVHGDRYLVATGLGIAYVDGRRTDVLSFPRTETAREPRAPAPAPVFAAVVDAEADRVLVRRRGERPQLYRRRGTRSELRPVGGLEVLDAVSLGDGRFVVITPFAGAEARRVLGLAVARLEGEVMALVERLSLGPASRLSLGAAARSAGPKGGLTGADDDADDDADDASEATGSDDVDAVAGVRDGSVIGATRLFASPYGIGVTSTSRGLLAVLDRTSFAPRFVVRAPMRAEQTEVFLLPLPDGALVTLVDEGGATEYALLDARGALVARTAEIGGEPASGATTEGVAWRPHTVLVGQDAVETHALSLPTLRDELVMDSGYPIDHGTDPTGDVHVLALTSGGLASPEHWQLIRVVFEGGKARDEELAELDFTPRGVPARAADAGHSDVARAQGNALLSLRAEDDSWVIEQGTEDVLEFALSNRGGPTRGTYVEVGGAAVNDGKLVRALEVQIDAQTAPLTRRGSVWRADFPELVLDAGFVAPSGKKAAPAPPDPSFAVALRIAGERAGSALLTVRAGDLANGTSGSSLAGRTLTVRKG